MPDPGGRSPRSRPNSRRRTSAFVIVAVVMALVAGLVVAAVSADGRELSRASANDGGAWVVNRELAAVGHKNHATGELSSYVRLTDSPSADVHQADGIVVVHDASTNQLFEVDPRSSNLDQAPTQLPEFTQVQAVDGALVVYRADPLAVWVINQRELTGLDSLANRPANFESATGGLVAAASDGRVVVADSAESTVLWINPDGTVSEPIALGFEARVIDITIVDASAVVLSDQGELVVVGPTSVERSTTWDAVVGADGALVRLQRPSVDANSEQLPRARLVAAVTSQGELVELTFDADTATITRRAGLAAASPIAPISHNGCIYGVATEPPTFGALCDDFTLRPLVGLGQQVRLRLVNGWIWVNDVESGLTLATNDELELEALDDWSLAIVAPAEEPEDEDEEEVSDPLVSDDTIIIDDPDADGDVRDSDDFDLGEANEPPVAVDDQAETRVDVTSVVDVLANDTDPNNDVLTVVDVELLSGTASIVITPNRTATQVTPGAGFSGTVQYRYSISDGRSPAVSAVVTLQVVSNEANRAPITVTDVVATAPGEAATIDVLRNDSDPDGDAILLTSITTESGTLRWDPSGQITFTPDGTTEAGWIELPYVVADIFGAEAEGRVRVEIRDRGANQEPDARNDQATTVVGRPVVLELPANDSDPDGDPLIVGSLPRLIEPEGAEVRTSTTADGEFVFAADTPGTYLFTYTISDSAADGSESDTARIRIDVLPNEDNEPPVAVRDDIVIPVGETRIVYVLENDGDPDGDVIAIVNWQVSPGLLVSEFNDDTGHVGFEITLTAAAGSQPWMRYSISDGINPDVSAPVAIAVSSRGPQNQPPFARDDVQELRAGQTVDVFVLENDFDPEGEPLRIVSVGTTDIASVTISPDAGSLAIAVPDDAVSSFSVPYDIEDPAGNRAAALLRVQLINPTAANRPPVARTDLARTQLAQPVAIVVLANDSDPDSDPIALDGIIEQPTRGDARASQDGSIVYSPDPNFRGTDVFTYAIIDGQGDRALGEVFIGVMDQAAQNLPPIANDDSYQLNSPAITPLDVLANDRDPEGDPLRVIDVSSATLGTVMLSGLTVSYQPPAAMAEAGDDTFTYVISDSAGNQAQATVTIELGQYEPEDEIEPEIDLTPEPTPVVEEPTPEPTPTVAPTPEATPDTDENLSPVARDDDLPSAKAGSDLVVDVLANDFDPDGDQDALRIVSVGEGGTTDGLQVFMTVGDGPLQLPYTIADEFGAEDSAVVSIVVTANQAPIVTALETATEFETPITLDLAVQVVDPDDDELFFICCDSPRGGSVEVLSAAAGELTVRFTPEADFAGQAGFSYTADDQKGHRPSGSVMIAVGQPGNRAPEVVEDAVSLPQRAPVNVDLAALVTDPDDDDLSYSFVQSSNPQVSVNIVGSQATLTADEALDAGTSGFFTYDVSDGILSTEGRIDYTIIEGENRPPIVADSSVRVKAASSETVDLRPLTTELDLRDSVDWTIEPLASSALSVELVGSLLTVRAQSSASGITEPIRFTATDTRGGSATGVITAEVVDTEAPEPTARPDTAPRTRPGESVEIDVLANDSDPLLDGLEITTLSEPSFGSATISIDNKVFFVAGDGEVGTATMSYTIRDQAGRESTATITIEVVSEPDQPAPPSAVPSSTQVAISWETPSLNGSVLQGYRITPNVGEPREIAVQNSYVWEDLVNGTEYSFTVTALSDLGESDESGPSPLVIPNQKPEPPVVRSVTFEDGALFVEWDEPTNLGTPITDYQIQLGGDSSGVDNTGGLRSYRWEPLENGANYTFELAAENDAGWSDFGPASTAEHPAAPPDVPQIGTTVRTNESRTLEVNWSVPASNNGDPVIEYFVRIAPNGTPVPIPGENTVTMEWSDLTNGEDVAFQVQARNRAGTSDWSAPSNAVKPCGRPEAPVITAATRGDRLATIAWTEPEQSGCDIIQYWVSANGDTPVPTSTLTREMGGLTNGTSYTFTVQAENEQGRSVLSAESQQVIPAGPPIFCPTSGTVSASATAPGTIQLSWDPAIANGDSASSLTYEVSTNGDGWVSTGDNTPSFTATPLQQNVVYSFDVRARNTVGLSTTNCGPASARTWALPVPLTATVALDTTDPVIREIVYEKTLVYSYGGPVTVLSAYPTRDGVRFGLPWSFSPPYPTETVDNPRVTTFRVPATVDGTYGLEMEFCNSVGCVDSVSPTIDVVLPKPPEQVLPSEIIMTQPFVFDAQNNFIGVELAFKVAMKSDSEPVTTYNYEIERRRSDESAWTPIDAGSGNYAAVAGSSPWSPMGNHDPLLGYSTHPQGMNGGLPYLWRVRVQAVNEVGEADWSVWASEIADRPSPTVRMVQLSGTRCTGAGPPLTSQCHFIKAELYGFPPNTVYEFDSWVLQGDGSYTYDESSGEFEMLGGDPRSGVAGDCDWVSVQTNSDGYIMAANGQVIECISRGGAQVRLVTSDGYASIWYPGVP